MERHYQTYREQVQADLFQGYAEYAGQTPTADPRNYPTVLDYLKKSTKQIQAAIASKVEGDYTTWLSYHQEAIYALLRKMFQDQLDPFEDKRLATLNLVHTYGWRSFKFADIVMHFDKFHVVPRYNKQVQELIYGDLPCFNADEMSLVMNNHPEEWVIEEILQHKKEYKSYLIQVSKQSWESVDLAGRNQVLVCDWTGRLH